MSEVRSTSVQYTVKTVCGLPVVYARRGLPTHLPGDYKWGRWRKAKLHEQSNAIAKLRELNA